MNMYLLFEQKSTLDTSSEWLLLVITWWSQNLVIHTINVPISEQSLQEIQPPTLYSSMVYFVCISQSVSKSPVWLIHMGVTKVGTRHLFGRARCIELFEVLESMTSELIIMGQYFHFISMNTILTSNVNWFVLYFYACYITCQSQPAFLFH